MWEVMNSGYVAVVLDALRSCYQSSHHKAPVIHNSIVVRIAFGDARWLRACVWAFGKAFRLQGGAIDASTVEKVGKL